MKIGLNHSLYPYWMLLQVARTGSIVDTARSLNVKAVTVASHMRFLEENYGKLYESGGLGIRFTPRGQVVLNSVQTFLSSLEALDHDQDCRPLEGCLSIAASSFVSAYLLPDSLARFQARHPGVNYRIEILPDWACLKGVQDGTTSLAVVLESPQHHQTNLERAQWKKETYRLFSHPESAVHKAEERPWRERLALTTLLLPERGSEQRELALLGLREWMSSFGATIEVGEARTLQEWVMAGLGLGFLAESAVKREVEQGRLKPVELPNAEKTRNFTLLRRSGSTSGRLYTTFWDYLLRTAAGAEEA